MSEDLSIGPARKLQLAKEAKFKAVDEYFVANWPLDTDEKYAEFKALEALAEEANAEWLRFIRPKGPQG